MESKNKITNCVFGIHTRNKKILLVKNLYKEFGPIWGIPGGKQEFGETFEQTLIREFKEEVGLDITIGRFITLFERIQPKRPFHLVSPVFEVFSEKIPTISNKDNVSEYKFFSEQEITSNHETIMNRKELLLFLKDPKLLPPISTLSQELDAGPLAK
jgi:ADP-ribose pyrophosphatase YjhB (NUDIX family)